jgi:hypothetical protein
VVSYYDHLGYGSVKSDKWLPEEHADCIIRAQLRQLWEVAGPIETEVASGSGQLEP